MYAAAEIWANMPTVPGMSEEEWRMLVGKTAEYLQHVAGIAAASSVIPDLQPAIEARRQQFEEMGRRWSERTRNPWREVDGQ